MLTRLIFAQTVMHIRSYIARLWRPSQLNQKYIATVIWYIAIYSYIASYYKLYIYSDDRVDHNLTESVLEIYSSDSSISSDTEGE